MLQPMPARYRNVFPSLGPCRPGCWGCIRQLNSMPQWPQQLQPSVLPRPAGRSAACGGRLLYPPLTSPSLQGRSWPLNATTQKTLSAHPVRMVSTSRAGQRKGTARPMKSVRTVSAPCPQRVGPQGLHSTWLTLTVSPLPLTDAGLIVKRHGNATHNTVCQCRAGMHCSDASCQTCVENEPCKQGFGFVAGETQPLPSLPWAPCAGSIDLRCSRGWSLPLHGALPELCEGCTAADLPATSTPFQPWLKPG